MAPTAALTTNLFVPWWQSSQSQFRNNLSCPFVIRQPGELFGGVWVSCSRTRCRLSSSRSACPTQGAQHTCLPHPHGRTEPGRVSFMWQHCWHMAREATTTTTEFNRDKRKQGRQVLLLMRMKKHLRALRHHYYYFNATGGGFVPSGIDTLIGRHFPERTNIDIGTFHLLRITTIKNNQRCSAFTFRGFSE